MSKYKELVKQLRGPYQSGGNLYDFAEQAADAIEELEAENEEFKKEELELDTSNSPKNYVLYRIKKFLCRAGFHDFCCCFWCKNWVKCKCHSREIKTMTNKELIAILRDPIKASSLKALLELRETSADAIENLENEVTGVRRIAKGLQDTLNEIAALVDYQPGPDAYEIKVRVEQHLTQVTKERDELKEQISEAEAVMLNPVKSKRAELLEEYYSNYIGQW